MQTTHVDDPSNPNLDSPESQYQVPLNPNTHQSHEISPDYHPYFSSTSESQSPPPPPREYYIPTLSAPELPSIYMQSTIPTNKLNIAKPTITYNGTIKILPVDDGPFNPNNTNADSDHQHLSNPNSITPIPPSFIPSPTPPTFGPNAKPHLIQLLKDKNGYSSLQYKNQILCETCMKIIPTYQHQLHINGQQHQKKLQQKLRPNPEITKVCDVCGWQTRARDYCASYEKHLTCRKHVRMVNWLKALSKA